jgi:hypothetical protein
MNTVKAMSLQVGKRYLCIKIAAFRISIGSLLVRMPVSTKTAHTQIRDTNSNT